jgi:hypothetical protein
MVQRSLDMMVLSGACCRHPAAARRVAPVLRRELLGAGGPLVRDLMTEEEREGDIQNREDARVWGGLACRHCRDLLLLLAALGPEPGLVTRPGLEGELGHCLEVGGGECIVPVLRLAAVLGLHAGPFLDTALRSAGGG